jgi:hypothetical protein
MKTIKYPKIYATVLRFYEKQLDGYQVVNGRAIPNTIKTVVFRPQAGEDIECPLSNLGRRTKARNRNKIFKEGVVVKLYWREGRLYYVHLGE